MSSVSDAFTGGGSGTSGVDTSSLFNDASLGSQITGGGDPFAAAGGDNFNTFNDVLNAFSGGGISSANAAPIGAATPAAAAATGGDPTGSTGGTQSNTTPGSTAPAQGGQGGQGGQNQQSANQQQNQYAPKSAIQQLIQALQGKPQGPTGLMNKATAIPTGGVNAPPAPVLPTLTPGETGPPSSTDPVNAPIRTFPDFPGGGSQPAPARIPPGAASAPDPGAVPLPTLTRGETGPPSVTAPQVDAQGNPLTVAGTRADKTPLPPPRPGDAQTASTTDGKPTPKTDDQGNAITVQPKAQPKVATKDLPTKVPLPTHKGGPEPAPAPAATMPATTQIQRDISGVSTGNPAALQDLAQAAMMILPLIGMFAGGGRGRHGRFGGFRGGRFTHGIGGGFGGRGHLGGRGMWPYHHPTFGWRMHGYHPGGGWRPMSPQDGMNFGLNPQQDPNAQDPNALDPDRPPKETGADPGPPSGDASGAIPGVTGKQVDDYTRQAASKWGIDPNIASKILAQESSYGQARRPGDNGTSFGPFQLHFAPDGRAMGDDFVRDTGKNPRDPSTWKDQIDYAMKRAAMGGWGPWTTTMKKLGLNQWSGITTNRQFAGLPRTNQQPSNVVRAASIPPTLPVTSQPNVAAQ